MLRIFLTKMDGHEYYYKWSYFFLYYIIKQFFHTNQLIFFKVKLFVLNKYFSYAYIKEKHMGYTCVIKRKVVSFVPGTVITYIAGILNIN